MFQMDHTPGRTALIDGKEYLFFSGYSYLGMTHVPEFVELIKEGIDRYGWLFPSSRISNTQLDLFVVFESKLSEITGMEASTCFSSGFLAGRAVMSTLQEHHSNFYSPPGTHPAIAFPNNIFTENFVEWSEQVVERINTLKTSSPVVISLDTVNPLTAAINDLSFLDAIIHPTICIIDDSHRIGLVTGKPDCNNSMVQLIMTYSLGKAFNLSGGAVSGNLAQVATIRNTAHYTASTSIAPAFAYAFIEGQELYAQQRKKLQDNIALFRRLTRDRFQSHPVLPIFILPASIDIAKLEEKGIIISSFAYPDPKGEKISRVVLNALHGEEDLRTLSNVLDQLI